MTDSNTPDWVKEEAFDLIRSVYPVVDEDERPYIPADELPTVSQALLSAYERGRTEREWQDISTAPKDGTLFLAARDDEWVTMVRWLVDEEAFYEVNNDPSDSWGFGPALPTHWMSLPAPPAIRQLLEVKG